MKTDTSKSTILVISMGFLILFLVFSWHWAVIVSLVTGIIGIFSTFLSGKIEWVWMKIAKVFELVVPKILLSVLFFFILFPIALLSRLFNKDVLMLSRKHKTYFIDINKTIDKKSFEKIW